MARLLIVLLTWLAPIIAYAEVKCTPECFCDKGISTLHIPSPKGFLLVVACGVYDSDYKPIDLRNAKAIEANRFDYGTYFYRGNVTLTGEIRKLEDGPNGTVVYFYPKIDRPNKSGRLSRLQESVLLERISLDDDEKIGTKNLVPTEKQAWCADSTLTFRKLYIDVADTEGTGPGGVEYEVVRVGRYRKC